MHAESLVKITLAAVMLAFPGEAGAGVQGPEVSAQVLIPRNVTVPAHWSTHVLTVVPQHSHYQFSDNSQTTPPPRDETYLISSYRPASSHGSARDTKPLRYTMATRAGSLVASITDVVVALGKLPRAAITATLLGLFTAALSARVAYRWYRLSHIPGPFWASFSSLWMVKVTLEGRAPEAWKQATDKYGPSAPSQIFIRPTLTVIGSLARVGPNDLVTDDPDVLRRMMAVRSSYTRGPCTFHCATRLLSHV